MQTSTNAADLSAQVGGFRKAFGHRIAALRRTAQSQGMLELLRIIARRWISRVGTRLFWYFCVLRLKKVFAGAGDEYTVVLFSTVDWNFPYKQRPQHVAVALARAGVRCVYVSPLAGKDLILGYRRVNPRLFVLGKWDSALIRDKRTAVCLLSTDQRLTVDGILQFKRLGVELLYDYIDELHDSILGRPIPDAYRRAHEMLLEDADVLCLTSAHRLYDAGIKARGKNNILLVSNAVDAVHFSNHGDSLPITERFRRITASVKPIIGYYGALASWLDPDLIEYLVSNRPQYQIVLLGPAYDGAAERFTSLQYENLHVLPPVNYVQLPAYARKFDVAIIPFRLNTVTQATSPLKLFEYMALGKPIVSMATDECRRYPSVLVASNYDEFAQKVDEAFELRNSSTYRTRLVEDLRGNTWDDKALIIRKALETKFACRSITMRIHQAIRHEAEK